MPREDAIQSSRLLRLLDTLGWLLMVAVPFGVVTLVARDTSIWARALEVGAVVGLVAAFLARRRWQGLADEVRERLDTLDRCTPDLLFETDPRGVITFANHCSTSILGYTPEEFVGKSLCGLTEGAIPLLDTLTPEDGYSATWNTRWMRADGDRVMLTAVLTSARAGGAPHGVRGVVRAQQDRLETEVELRDSEERFRAALDTTRNGLMLVANDGRLLMANQALRTLLERSADEMAHLTVNDVVPGVYVDQFVSLMTSRMWSDAVPSQFELQLQSSAGLPLDVEITLSPVREGGSSSCTLIEVHDLTESRRTSEAIRRMADYDRLTGLPNRELFDRHVQRALIDARYQSRSVAVLMLDLDRFKLINDTLGHTSGDRLLKAVAERLGAHIPQQHILARFGGDDLLLAPDLGGRAGAEGIARRILSVFREPFDHDEHQLKVSVSVGVAVSNGGEADADLLIRIADAATHQAKENGRDTYVIGSEGTSDLARQRLELESDLRDAVEREELEV